MCSLRRGEPMARVAPAGCVEGEAKCRPGVARLALLTSGDGLLALPSAHHPHEARVADVLPPEGDWAFEPKWDGFRAIAWSGEVRLDSRNQRPLLRYFPELEAPLRALPAGTVVDGEVVVVRGDRPDFDALQNRLHPAASRAARLARETPATLVAFDLLAADGRDLRGAPFDMRRERLVALAARLPGPWVLTPSTSDRELARRWFDEFEAAGCEGIVAKRRQGPYAEGKRDMVKVKHRRTVDCVVGGYRTAEEGDGVGSILLGLYDGEGRLHFIGHCSGFPQLARPARPPGAAALRRLVRR